MVWLKIIFLAFFIFGNLHQSYAQFGGTDYNSDTGLISDSIPPKPKIRRINGKHSEELMKEAISHFDGQRYARCIEILGQAISINDFEEITDILYYYRAIAQTRIKAYPLAIANFDSAITANPNKSHYYYYQGNTYLQLGSEEQAITSLDKAIELDGDNVKAYVKRGFVKHQEKDYKAALSDYNQAVDIDPNYADAYYYRGLTMFRVLMPDKGCEDFQKAVELGSRLAIKMQEQYCKP